MEFLKEYWLWIAVPFALVIGGLLMFVYFLDEGATSPFSYNVF